MAVSYDVFCQHYTRWLNDCLNEWNEKQHQSRRFAQVPEGDYAPGDVVEFAEDGDAYPHGIGGTGHVRRAVTPWRESIHYVQ